MKAWCLGLAWWMISATLQAASTTDHGDGAITLSQTVSGIETVSSGGDSGFQLAEIQAMSEPETWALFFGGILLGLFWNQLRVETRRRR